ncbi:putative leucine-rich repeat receptor-like serine/threonine-protein kinase [Panicum miliaceum]|uniref:Leucine-rich repeat receptor-like serine/threonine-protein kinase n=1 Tax=Panicum miliaceum TaxID=4540 RepID=A0A3L6PE07_PANMI|nr:putative leucine-rich repeat receptor-like serine/threonine-protein kinase [Panicum miliaceum]
MAKMLLTGISSPNLLVIPTMPRFLALITIAIAVVCSNHASAVDSQASDHTALLSFKSCVWGNLSDWGSPKMCNWSGVTCDSRGRVIYLLLSNSNLTGVISPAIGNLSALRRLDLQSNQLSGIIPPELGMLSQLEELNLNINLLNGLIPEALGLLKSIAYLSMYGNNLTGSIPEAVVCNCSSLTHINLRTNSLTGEIPFSARCRLPYLKKIILYENRLVGIIPSSISNFTSLDWVLLQSNFLGGELPSQMFNTMPSLKYLYLSNNNFSSDAGNTNLEPFLASLVNCTSLEELGVESNSIGGKIPPMIGNLSTNLTKIYLYDNKITGQIPTGVAGLSNLQIYLNLSNNLLEGPLPLEFGNMDKIQALDLSANKLSGAIPAQIKGCAGVEYVNLSRNFLQGTLPSSIGALPSSLHVLDVSFNRLTGMIPQSLQASPVLWFANFSYNNFTSEVSSEGAFANLTGDSFLGNPGLCGSILRMVSCRGKHGHLLYIAIIVVVTIAAGLLAMVCIVDHDLMNSRLRLTPPSIQLSHFRIGPDNAVGQKEGEHPRISYRELVDATDGFSEVNSIGKGGYGHVYRGVLHGGTEIAVKVLHQDQVGGEHDVDAVVERSLPRDPPSVLPFGPPEREMEAIVVTELLELGVACSQLAPSMRPAMDDVAHEIACLRDGTWRKYRATDLKAIDQIKSNKH